MKTGNLESSTNQMPCNTCLYFSPVRLASMANASIQRWGPGPDCDFKLNPPPMTDEEFETTIKEYECERYESA